MNLPADTHLAYTVWHEAWYAKHSPLDEKPHLMVAASAHGTGGGVAWEFAVEQYQLAGKAVTRVQMFDDAYAAFAQLPEFFTALAARTPGTLGGVRAILDELGAADETARVSPYDDRPVTDYERGYEAGRREALSEAVRPGDAP